MTSTDDAGAGVGPRRQHRETALGLLYEAEVTDRPPAEVVAGQAVPVDPFVGNLTEGVGRHQDDLDALIERHAIGWTISRMPALDRIVLRMGAFELVHSADVPTGVVLSEAVDLAAAYSTEKSSAFVNGVLDAVAEEVRDV